MSAVIGTEFLQPFGIVQHLAAMRSQIIQQLRGRLEISERVEIFHFRAAFLISHPVRARSLSIIQIHHGALVPQGFSWKTVAHKNSSEIWHLGGVAFDVSIGQSSPG